MTPEPNPLFGGAPLGEPQGWHASHLGLDCPGEVVVAEQWNDRWRQPLQGDMYFRLVLLLGSQGVESARLQDPHIVVCLPDLASLEEAHRLGREQQSLREAQATYEIAQRPDLLPLGRSLGEQQEHLGQQARQVYLQVLVQGSVVTSQMQTPVQETLTEPGAIEDLVDRLVGWLLAGATPSLPLDGSSFPSTLTPRHVEALYAALTGERQDTETRTVAQTFGPGLGLCERDAPLTLTVHQSPVIALLRQAQEEGGGRLVAGDLLHHLAHEQRLTYPLATLYLLLYLFSQPDLELTLLPGHPLHLLDGTPFLGDRLFRELLPDLAWPSDLIEWVRTLAPASPPTWRTARPYVSAFLHQTGGFLSLEEEAEQQGRLFQQLREMETGLRSSAAALERLANLLRVSPPEELRELQPLAEVARSRELEGFLTAARRAVGGPLTLRRVVDTNQRARRLQGVAPEIHHAYTYLHECSDVAEDQDQDLALQRQTLLAQFDLPGLLHNPSLWDGLRIQYASFQQRYAVAYVAHHTQFHQELGSLQSYLAAASAQAAALEQFNTLVELGAPLGVDLPERMREMLASLEPCPGTWEVLSLEAQPFCTTCRLRPGDQPPTEAVHHLAEEVRDTLRDQNRRLSSAAIRRILARPDEALTDKFVKVVQSSDLSALAEVLDAEVLEFLRRFLRRG